MKIKIILKWDLIKKLLNPNEIEIHLEKNKYNIIFLYLINKNTPKNKFILQYTLTDYQTIEEYVNNMSVYNFKEFYEELTDKIKIMKTADKWYENLNI